jgi:hypothetical protein
LHFVVRRLPALSRALHDAASKRRGERDDGDSEERAVFQSDDEPPSQTLRGLTIGRSAETVPAENTRAYARAQARP